MTEKQSVWILTREINEYDQDGAYFERAFYDKPSFEDLKMILRTNDDAYVRHVLGGGGRLDVEHTWYNLFQELCT